MADGRATSDQSSKRGARQRRPSKHVREEFRGRRRARSAFGLVLVVAGTGVAVAALVAIVVLVVVVAANRVIG